MSNLIFLLLHLLLQTGLTATEAPVINGKQPEISTDPAGAVRLVFGRNDSIFCAAIAGGGFTTPVFLARVPQMHLGMTRGPQIASSTHYSMITAMDKRGSVHWFLLDNKTLKCIDSGLANDKEGSAPEGLMGLAANEGDYFYAVWLDTRVGRTNNICFASFSPLHRKWSANAMVYISPEGHTCECCKPNIAVRGKHVAIMFRNWLAGARDLYVIESSDGGKKFGKARKLGSGTWKLNGCPMDGGGIAIDGNNHVHTVWQREGIIYYCQPGMPEKRLAEGRSCSIAVRDGQVLVSYQRAGEVMLTNPESLHEEVVGRGAYLKTVLLARNAPSCAWEQDGKVYAKVLPPEL